MFCRKGSLNNPFRTFAKSIVSLHHWHNPGTTWLRKDLCWPNSSFRNQNSCRRPQFFHQYELKSQLVWLYYCWRSNHLILSWNGWSKLSNRKLLKSNKSETRPHYGLSMKTAIWARHWIYDSISIDLRRNLSTGVICALFKEAALPLCSSVGSPLYFALICTKKISSFSSKVFLLVKGVYQR